MNILLQGVPASRRSKLLGGLRSYWKLGESTGTTRRDSTSAVDLTDVSGDLALTTGVVGGAVAFPGTGGRVLQANNPATLRFGNEDFTVAGWCYLADTSGVYGLVSKFASGTYEYMVRSNAGTLEFYVSVTGSDTFNIGVAGLAATTWTWFRAWHDSVANTINVQANNGTPASQAHLLGVNAGTSDFQLGNLQVAGQYLNGRMDEVGVWSRVLTDAEAAALYNGGQGRTYPFRGA